MDQAATAACYRARMLDIANLSVSDVLAGGAEQYCLHRDPFRRNGRDGAHGNCSQYLGHPRRIAANWQYPIWLSCSRITRWSRTRPQDWTLQVIATADSQLHAYRDTRVPSQAERPRRRISDHRKVLRVDPPT